MKLSKFEKSIFDQARYFTESHKKNSRLDQNRELAVAVDYIDKLYGIINDSVNKEINNEE